MTTLHRTLTIFVAAPLTAALTFSIAPIAMAKDHAESKHARYAPPSTHLVADSNEPQATSTPDSQATSTEPTHATSTKPVDTPSSTHASSTRPVEDAPAHTRATSTPPVYTPNSLESIFMRLFNMYATSTKPVASSTRAVATSTLQRLATSTIAAAAGAKTATTHTDDNGGGGAFNFRALETFFFPESVYPDTHFSRRTTFELLALASVLAGIGSTLIFGTRARATEPADMPRVRSARAALTRRRVPMIY